MSEGEVFYGYCIDQTGRRVVPTKLGADQVKEYLEEGKALYPEIRVEDGGGRTVAHALNGHIAYPLEWAEIEP